MLERVILNLHDFALFLTEFILIVAAAITFLCEICRQLGLISRVRVDHKAEEKRLQDGWERVRQEVKDRGDPYCTDIANNWVAEQRKSKGPFPRP